MFSSFAEKYSFLLVKIRGSVVSFIVLIFICNCMTNSSKSVSQSYINFFYFTCNNQVNGPGGIEYIDMPYLSTDCFSCNEVELELSQDPLFFSFFISLLVSLHDLLMTLLMNLFVAGQHTIQYLYEVALTNLHRFA